MDLIQILTYVLIQMLPFRIADETVSPLEPPPLAKTILGTIINIITIKNILNFFIFSPYFTLFLCNNHK